MWGVSFPAHQLLYSWLLPGPCKHLHFGLNAEQCKLGSPAQWEGGESMYVEEQISESLYLLCN